MSKRVCGGTSAAKRLARAVAALSLGVAACAGASGARPPVQLAESVPPNAAPGAAPSANRLIGTWTVTEVEGGSAGGRGDHAESTTYRFQDAGRVTVAGRKQCAYALDGAELKVDCDGRPATGTLEFRGDRSIQWRIGGGPTITLIKR